MVALAGTGNVRAHGRRRRLTPKRRNGCPEHSIVASAETSSSTTRGWAYLHTAQTDSGVPPMIPPRVTLNNFCTLVRGVTLPQPSQSR